MNADILDDYINLFHYRNIKQLLKEDFAIFFMDSRFIRRLFQIFEHKQWLVTLHLKV